MLLPLLALLLQTAQTPQRPVPGALENPIETTPPSGDTTGYWQQRVRYTIVATLDEPRTRLRARAELRYVNESPDTLHEMYVHQYLNAFRPGSRWSAVDEREGRVRFQRLRDPQYGYERFTAAPTVDGVGVLVDYPGAPDSTVAHFRLPRPLAPHDSTRVVFEWEARPSTVWRRQGRSGRTWDFAQWYPKVAVYDRMGWEPNALQPAGELYGEYGAYDVTLIVADDQIVVGTGVPVAGDPGWARARRPGSAAPRLAARAYDSVPPPSTADVPAGYRAVRFVARGVHHFAWSASPEYRYEGGIYVRSLPATHYPTWDTVSVHVLYKPGDDTTWGGGRAVARTITALRWLESIWGPYAYPQMSNVHRLDGGGTEFPMMVMNGSASQGLILHEVGHNFTYGILGNNEWRSGWMDEGLTSYQTSWAEGLTPQERRRGPVPEPPRLPEGYRVNAVTIPRADSANLDQIRLDLTGVAQPIGTNAADFHDFFVYDYMIYDRAELMYGQLRDALGDSAFRSFFHDYYRRWALKHVDELAMRASAERASGRDLGWFFDQWVYHTGVLDYALAGQSVARRPDGRWLTRARVVRRGEYRHPMPVGVRTDSGWTVVHGDASRDDEVVEITTATEPREVRLDPYHVTWDWDRRNDVASYALPGFRQPRMVFDWPFLDQADREHSIMALAPMLWLGDPLGLTAGARVRSSYLGWLDRWEAGAAFGARTKGAGCPADAPCRIGDARAPSAASRAQLWLRTENPYLPLTTRPLVGVKASSAFLDGVGRLDASLTRDLGPSKLVNGPRVSLTTYALALVSTDRYALPDDWSFEDTGELGAKLDVRLPEEDDGSTTAFSASIAGGPAGGRSRGRVVRSFARVEGSVRRLVPLRRATTMLAVRGYLGATTDDAPPQRAVFASSADPAETFWNHWYRPRGALLDRMPAWLSFVPPGGAQLRGYSPHLALSRVAAANVEAAQRLVQLGDSVSGRRALWASLFADGALAASDHAVLGSEVLADAGVSLAIRGRLFDRDLRLRLDLPLFVHQPAFAIDARHGHGHGELYPRFGVSSGALW